MLNYITITITIWLLFTSCISGKGESRKTSPLQGNEKHLINKTDTIFTSGIIRIKTDVLEQQGDTVLLINKNGNVVDLLHSSDEYEPYFVNAKNISIRHYYPDYYIVILDAIKENGKYKVFFNEEWLFISDVDSVTIYEDWATHLKNSFILTNSENPLRVLPEDNSKEISCNYSISTFICTKVEGDWVYVICNIDCEGCPNNKNISGWLRWKENNKLLIKLYYIC